MLTREKISKFWNWFEPIWSVFAKVTNENQKRKRRRKKREERSRGNA
jgi:hypothetical protein